MEREPEAWRSLFPWGQRVNLPATAVERQRELALEGAAISDAHPSLQDREGAAISDAHPSVSVLW
jgi:hypothetical protein